MKTSARAVVIGGGVVGASVLYHLAKIGWTRRAAAREERAHLRFDLARRRRHAHLQRRGEHLAPAEVHDRPVPGDRGALGPVLRPASQRRTDAGGHPGRARQPEADLLARALPRHGNRDDLARGGARVQSADRPAAFHRRAVARRRRPLRSVRHHPGLREGGAQARRRGRALHARAGAAASARDGSWDVLTDKGTVHAEHVVNCARTVGARGRAPWSASSCRCWRWSITT